MTGHRYWRVFNRINNGDGSFTGVTEIEMAESAVGADVTTTGNAISSGSFQAGTAASAFNNDFTGDVAQWNGTGAGKWLGQDFGVGVTKDIVEVRIRPNKDAAARTFREFDIQYSDDNVTWTTLWSVSYTGWSVGTTATFSKPGAGPAYRYWRLRFPGGSWSNAFALATLEMRTALNGADQCSGGTAITFNAFAGVPASNAFDGNSSTLWGSTDNTDSNYIGYDFGSGVTKAIIEFYVLPRQDTTNFKQYPKTASVEASSDGINWLPKWVINNFLQPYDAGGAIFRDPSAVTGGSTHRWWGIRATATQTGSTFGIDELEFRATIGGADNTSGGIGEATSAFDNTSVAKVAFSGTSAEYSAAAAVPTLLVYDYGNGNEKALPAQIAVTARANGGFNNHNQAPTAFDLVYSDDGHNFTTQQSFTSPATWTTHEQRLFAVTQPATRRRSGPCLLIAA